MRERAGGPDGVPVARLVFSLWPEFSVAWIGCAIDCHVQLLVTSATKPTIRQLPVFDAAEAPANSQTSPRVRLTITCSR